VAEMPIVISWIGDWDAHLIAPGMQMRFLPIPCVVLTNALIQLNPVLMALLLLHWKKHGRHLHFLFHPGSPFSPMHYSISRLDNIPRH